MTLAVAQTRCFKDEATLVPPCAFPPGGAAGTRGLGLVPAPGELFPGGAAKGAGGERGANVCAGEGKPPGSGQPLPKKQSHSDERLIAIVFFLFSEGRAAIPRARLQCGTGWLWLVAVRQLQPRRSRLTEAQSRRQHLLTACHPRTKDAGG